MITPNPSTASAHTLRFADCELRLDERRLLIDGRPVALGGRAFDLLQVLASHSGQPVSKNTLLDTLWPDQDVEEGNLPVHVSTLRRLLGPQAIFTVPGQGYRFMLAVHTEATPSPAATPLGGPAFPQATGLTSAKPSASADDAVAQRRSNLPPHGPRLIGRDADLQQLRELLPHALLLSLVGASGIGKTSLARQLAREALAQHPDEHRDGVWWVDLADLRDAAELPARIGHTLGIALNRAPQPHTALLKGLRDQQLLLVLDNCEHLVAEVAALVEAALQHAPGVRWLITSQEPLKLALEQVYRPDTLAVPPTGTPLAQALGYGALALLLDRALACDRRFQLRPDQVDAAIDLCAQLDGIALALEMAAARLPWLGLDGVRQRLGQRLQLFRADQRFASPRHQTLYAALDWSHSLLTPQEQTVFRRLAVFHGGFSLSLAEAVLCDSAGLSPWDAIDALGALVDKSLVSVLPGPQPRYRLLESTRLYAWQALEDSAEVQDTCQRHAQQLAHRAQTLCEAVWQLSDTAWLLQAEPEADNLRAALDWALSQQDAACAAPLLDALNWLNNLLGGGTEVRQRVPQTEPLLAGAAPAVAARLLMVIGSTYRNNAPARAVEYLARAADQYHSAGDERGRFRVLCAGATTGARAPGRQAWVREALAQAQTLMQPHWPARLRMFEAEAAGMVAACLGTPEQAREHYRRYREIVLAAGAEGALVTALLNLADIALMLGDGAEAVRIGREHVAWLRRRRNSYALGWALGNLCAALVHQGELEAACAAGREALPLMRAEEYAAWLFDHFALLAALRGQWRVSAVLLGHAQAARDTHQLLRDPTERHAHEQTLALLARHLPAPVDHQLRQQGQRLSAAQADALAFADDSQLDDARHNTDLTLPP